MHESIWGPQVGECVMWDGAPMRSIQAIALCGGGLPNRSLQEPLHAPYLHRTWLSISTLLCTMRAKTKVHCLLDSFCIFFVVEAAKFRANMSSHFGDMELFGDMVLRVLLPPMRRP